MEMLKPIRQQLQVVFLIILFGMSSFLLHAQAGEWTWIHGSNTAGSFGNFGIQGVPSPTNEPPALYGPSSWIDNNGNFWIFGGDRPDGQFACDLWKYDPITNEWTWMKGSGQPSDTGSFGTQGVPSSTNYPPQSGFGVPTWVDSQGNLWMYGCCFYNDLWKYDISTNEWTWVKGHSSPSVIFNTLGIADSISNPGAGFERTSSWVDDNGDFWFFGGDGYGTGMTDALWKYNVSSGYWTWMKGDSTPNHSRVYGIIGIEDSLNTPGARISYSHWKDNSGGLWLFGGNLGFPNYPTLNDLWRFNTITNKWAYMGGNSSLNVSGIYGNKCVQSATNIPGSRFENRAVFNDSSGNFWMFGGARGGTSFTEVWNDLWVYNSNSNIWVWISGDNYSNPLGNWGVKGVPSLNNKPTGRGGTVMWGDNLGNLYFFGGWDQTIPSGHRNDLWKFTIDSTCIVFKPVSFLAASDTVFCGNQCINFFDLSANNPTSWLWLFSGAATVSSTLQNPTNICYNTYGSFQVTLITCNSAGCDTLVYNNFINVYPAPIPVITQSNDTLFSLFSPAFTYQWWSVSNGLIAGATNNYFIPTQIGNYYVIVTNSVGCPGISDTISINPFAPGVNLMSSDTTFCEKQCIDFYDLSTNNPTSWQWFFPGADSTSSTLQYPFHICYNNYGSFDVTLIACNAVGCDTLIYYNFINEYPAPIPVITQSNDTLFSSGGFSYQWWSVSGGIITGATNNYYVPTQGGDYYVIVTDTNGCAGASNTIAVTGINQSSIVNGQLSIIPNPNDGSFTITLNTIIEKDFSLRIINHIGQTLNNHQWSIVNGPQVINVKMGDVAKGLYAIELINGNKVYRGRFIVQ